MTAMRMASAGIIGFAAVATVSAVVELVVPHYSKKVDVAVAPQD